MKRIYLHGRLAELFGEYYDLEVATPAEGVRGLCVLIDDFEGELRQGYYRIIRGPLEDGDDLDLDTIRLNFGKQDQMHIVPVTEAAGIEVIALIIAGVALAAALAAVLFIPTPPKADDRERGQKKSSFLFDGPVNVTEQGHSVPLVYGEIRTGSIVVSAGIETTDIPYLSLGDKIINAIRDFATAGFEGSPLGDDNINIVGLQKGGKGGGGDSFKEDPNTLQSQSTARILELISEGEIEGLVDGMKSIYLDDTPIQNSDGTFNFKGVAVEERVGLPDQDFIQGFAQQETVRPVGVEMTELISPVITITDPDVNRARVDIRIPALHKTKPDKGHLKKYKVSFAIDLQSNGGGFTTIVEHTINGKTSSDYIKSFDILLPAGSEPWDIRARRVSPDSESSLIEDKTFFDGVTEIIDAKLQYPDSALVGIIIDAKQFGSTIPDRSYHVRGLKILVPSNYNPTTREYTGVWNGTFQRAWTDNPAWVFYDLIVNDRYGLGRFIDPSQVDKFSLYAIAQYCDELVDDGQGGTAPRFTFNGVIRNRSEAYEVLATIASSFRGAAYWSANSISAFQDRPSDPVRLVTPSNATGGRFTYEDTVPIRERRTAVIVYYNDPEDGYRLAPEVVEDPNNIRTKGWRPGEEITAVGCTSRAQAHRLGKWVLEEERYGQEAVSYETGDMHADVLPGQIIVVADPDYTEQRQGGRIVHAASNIVQLDSTVSLESGYQYVFKAVLPDGTVGSENVTNSPGSTDKLSLANAFTPAPLDGAVWALETTAVKNRQYRVRQIQEVGEGQYRITALRHDPDKYSRVEENLLVAPVDLEFLPTEPLIPPSGLNIQEYLYQEGTSAAIPSVLFSWSASRDPRVTGYQVQYQTPDDDNWTDLPDGADLFRDIIGIEPGDHSFRVRAVDALRRKTAWVQTQPVTLLGQIAELPEVTTLTFSKDNVAMNTILSWIAPANETRPLKYNIYYNTALNFDTAELIGTTEFTEYVVAREGYYWVQTAFLDAVSPSPTNVHLVDIDLPQPVWERLYGFDFDPNNLWPDTTFENSDTLWASFSEWSFVTDPLTVFGTVLKLEPNLTGSHQEPLVFSIPVSSGDKLDISYYGLRDSDAIGQAGVTILYKDKFGNQIEFGWDTFDVVVENSLSDTTWTKITGRTDKLANGQFPEAAVATVHLINRSNRTAGNVWIARPSVTRYKPGSTDNSDALVGTILTPAVLKDQGDGTTRPVAIGIADGKAEDADNFTFSPAWQDIPKIIFGAGGLLSESTFTQVAYHDYKATNASTSGFTASLRIKEAVASTNSEQSDAFSSSGTGPREQADFGSGSTSGDDTYLFNYGVIFVSGNPVVLEAWTNDGSGWVKRGSKQYSGGFHSASDEITVSGLQTGDQFGIDWEFIGGSGSITIDPNPVTWVSYSPTGDEPATTSTVKVPFLVIGNVEGGL